MSNFQVGGPTLVSVGLGANGAALFLGYTESSVKYSLHGEYDDVFADIGGSKIPVDVQFMGMHAFVSADFVLWNEGPMNLLRAKARTNTDGAINAGMIGALMVNGGLAHHLWIVRQYGTNGGSQNGGIHFHNAFPIDALELETGTRYSRVRCMWRCLPLWNSANNTAILHDYDLSLAAAPD